MTPEKALATAAQALETAALSHRRAQDYHRKRCRELRAELADLERLAAKYGFKLIIRKPKE